MSNQPISTRPLNDNEKLLREKFYQSIAGQSDLMDKLSERLLTLELAIPGLYATALKLLAGDKVTVAVTPALYATFGCWLLALLLTLLALMPGKWTVDPTVLQQDPAKLAEGLGIEDFFTHSALRKRRLLTASAALFFAGIVAALFTTVA